MNPYEEMKKQRDEALNKLAEAERSFNERYSEQGVEWAEAKMALADAITTGKQFEADSRKHFEQSCVNLARAKKAEKALAESQAREQALRVALLDVRPRHDCAECRIWYYFDRGAVGGKGYVPGKHRPSCRVWLALSAPTDDTALREFGLRVHAAVESRHTHCTHTDPTKIVDAAIRGEK